MYLVNIKLIISEFDLLTKIKTIFYFNGKSKQSTKKFIIKNTAQQRDQILDF